MITPLSSFDLSAYYPSDYYSYEAPVRTLDGFRLLLSRRRGRHLFGSFDPIGALIAHWKSPGSNIAMLPRYGVRRTDRVLDVGCGSGAFLRSLYETGFDSLTGCDPFVPEPSEEDGIKILKADLSQVEGVFDAIFFNHSFEHVPDPGYSLRQARARQAVGARCIVRCPTSSSQAFAIYRENWIELDPPRHISIPSRTGLKTLAKTCGYELVDMIDDSAAWDFIGSEQYKRDIPWISKQSYNVNPQSSIFEPAQIAEFERRAQAANAAHEGGRTAFVLIAR